MARPTPDAAPRTAPVVPRRTGRVRGFLQRHPAVVDWVVALWFGLPALAVLLWADPGLYGEQRALLGLLSAVGVVALLRRRHEPVLALATITVALVAAQILIGDSSGLEIAAVLALYAVAAYRRPTTAWLALVLLNAVYAAGVTLWAEPLVTVFDDTGNELVLTDLQTFWISASTMLALSVIVLALGLGARSRRLHIAALVERAAQLALERDQREQIALTTERNRIAREMHDVVAHSLSVMVALADGASAALEKRPEHARLALDELATTGRSALTDTRRLLGVLRDDAGSSAADGADPAAAPLTPQPTTPDIGELIARFQAAGLPVTVTESGPRLPDDAGLQLAVFRIVQEALTNVLRHAPGSPRIDVTVERHARFVVVEVDNDDGASAAAPQGGRGLVGMRERAAVYDGHVDAGPTSTGWRVRAVLRWSEGEL